MGMIDSYRKNARLISDAALRCLETRDRRIFDGPSEESGASRFARMMISGGINRKGTFPDGRTLEEFLSFVFSWTLHGMPSVRISHKLAASYMATSIPAEICDSIRAPWKFFQVHVPAGLISDDESTAIISHVRINDDKDGALEGARVRWLQTGVPGMSPTGGNHMLACAPWREFCEARKEIKDTFSRRVTESMMRLIFGIVIRLSNSPELTSRERGGEYELPKRKNGEPQCWKIVLADPITVDVRSAIRDYVRGNGSRITTRFIVRGHWKNQPYGPQSSLRKFIHVEPFWKGDKDAPIAVRSHLLKGAAE